MSSKSSSADVPSEPAADKVDNISSDNDSNDNNDDNSGGNQEEEQEFGVQGGAQWNTEGPFVNKPSDNENNESGTGDGSNV